MIQVAWVRRHGIGCSIMIYSLIHMCLFYSFTSTVRCGRFLASWIRVCGSGGGTGGAADIEKSQIPFRSKLIVPGQVEFLNSSRRDCVSDLLFRIQ